MVKGFGLAAIASLLGACAPSQDEAVEPTPSVMPGQEGAVDMEPSIASPGPIEASGSDEADVNEGRPHLTQADCLMEDGNIVDRYGNTKGCLMAACDDGDRASCEAMKSYNGNMEAR
jgi:hypothetical protein